VTDSDLATTPELSPTELESQDGRADVLRVDTEAS
jgi:hypothetical protein